MAVGVGIDIADVADVARSLDTFGDRYLRRVYTSREVAACAGGADARRLAAHFAAKEATLKTFLADDPALDWRDVEVDLSGPSPTVSLSGGPAEAAGRGGVGGFAVSVTVTGREAVAVVLATRA